jgi:hypothetical protein
MAVLIISTERIFRRFLNLSEFTILICVVFVDINSYYQNENP